MHVCRLNIVLTLGLLRGINEKGSCDCSLSELHFSNRHPRRTKHSSLHHVADPFTYHMNDCSLLDTLVRIVYTRPDQVSNYLRQSIEMWLQYETLRLWENNLDIQPLLTQMRPLADCSTLANPLQIYASECSPASNQDFSLTWYGRREGSSRTAAALSSHDLGSWTVT